MPRPHDTPGGSPHEPPESPVRRVLFVGALVVGLLAAGVVGFRALAGQAKRSERTASRPAPVMVRTVRAKRTVYTERLLGYGRARALRQATVAAEVAGRVVRVAPALEAGQAFEAPAPPTGGAAPGTPGPGPVVVQLDRDELGDRVARADAEIRAGTANVERLAAAARHLRERITLATRERDTARRERDRVERLVRDGGKLAPSDLDAQALQVLVREGALRLLEQTLDDNEQQQRVETLRLEARQADLAIAQRNLARTSVRVPFPGVIGARQVHAGDRVAVGQALFTILDLSQVEVPVSLPARFYADVEPGARVLLRAADTGTPLGQARVARKAPEIDPAERTFFAYVVVAGTPTANPIPPGAYVRAEVTGRVHPDVVVLPREAFDGEDLFVVRPDPEAPPDATPRRGLTARVTPRVSRWLADVALVTEGVAPGDEVVTTNLESVGRGTRVRIAPPPAAAPDPAPR